MTITIYRGNQIGGCITQIESAKGYVKPTPDDGTEPIRTYNIIL